jgi:hypothetical protein
MLLFWGFSSDGLGRNCLEPLSVTLLLATAATWSDRRPRRLPLWVGLVGIDSLWVVLGGFASARDFRLSEVDFAAGGWCALNIALTAALLWWGVRVWGHRKRIDASASAIRFGIFLLVAAGGTMPFFGRRGIDRPTTVTTNFIPPDDRILPCPGPPHC